MDGLEFLAEVRREAPDLPIVVMSGAGLVQDAIGALKLGAWDYIEKPFPAIEVIDHAVRRALERADLLTENRRYRESLEQVNRELRATLRLLTDDEAAGQQIQARMLPRNHQRFGSFEFSREIVPSAYLSGDFIDAFAIDDRRWGFYLADVAGHGVSSALASLPLHVQRPPSPRRFTDVRDVRLEPQAGGAGAPVQEARRFPLTRQRRGHKQP